MTDLIEEFHAEAERSGVEVGQLFENAVQKIYEAWLKPGDFAVDVGAHKGAHMFPMAAAVGRRGAVYAFEPIEPLFRKLKKDIKARQSRNVKLFQLALSDQAGLADFSYFEKRPAYSGLQRRATPFDDVEGGVVKIQVRRATLDSKLPFFRKVAAIKLDIEGGELHALMGARRCLVKSRPLVVFESGREASAIVYNYSIDDFFAFFDAVNMEVFWLSGEPFERAHWKLQRRCWEFVALPKEKRGFADRLPGLCRDVLAEAARLPD